jgi:hypothetical protein
MEPATKKNSTVTSANCKIADSVGAILKQARADLGCNRREAAAKTKIPERYITRFEEGSHDKLPDDVYTKIFLKVYCKFLGLDTQTIVNLHRQERLRAVTPHKKAADGRHPTTAIPTWQMLVTPQVIRAVFMSVVVLGLAVYFWMVIRNIVSPPAITLNSPPDGLVTTERTVTIDGRTENEVALRINGKYVAPDSLGNFKDTLELQEGLNVVKVVGMKKHGKEAVVIRRIIVEPKDRPTAALSGSGIGH